VRKILAGLFLLVAGCSTYTLVEPQRVSICDLYSVTPGTAWSEVNSGDARLWTVDGVDLQAIRFLSGIREGAPVTDITKEEHATAFRADMSESELVDAIVDGFALSGAQRVKARNLRPAAFGSLQGFRFELGYRDEDGVAREGAVAGAVVEESLYLIIYTGTRLHYFSKYAPEFETIVGSIRINEGSQGTQG
jgi:hypothetical protein